MSLVVLRASLLLLLLGIALRHLVLWQYLPSCLRPSKLALQLRRGAAVAVWVQSALAAPLFCHIQVTGHTISWQRSASRRTRLPITAGSLFLATMSDAGAVKLLKVRTITTGVQLSSDSAAWRETIHNAAAFNTIAASRLQESGFEVQTTRISTNSFEEYLDLSDPAAALVKIRELDAILTEESVQLFNAGPATSAAGVDLAVEAIKLSPRISCSAKVNDLDWEMALRVARAVLRIGAETEGGEGNFQFCASFNVEPGVPFFPAAYHGGESSFAFGCETSEVIARSLTSAKGDLASARTMLLNCMHEQLAPLEKLGHKLSEANSFKYGGIDGSIAPNPSATPLTDSFESLGLGVFGGPGTLTLCALVTSALKAVPLTLCGYTGLMLPPLEDAGLARRANEGTYGIQDLLTYSAVCGIGLDTVPIPGNVSDEKVAALYMDVAALAFRLKKPLSARLFPTPGKVAGDMTEFKNPHLCNAQVFEV